MLATLYKRKAKTNKNSSNTKITSKKAVILCKQKAKTNKNSNNTKVTSKITLTLRKAAPKSKAKEPRLQLTHA